MYLRGTFSPEPQSVTPVVTGNLLTSVWIYEMKSNYKVIFGLDEKMAPLEIGVVNRMAPLFTLEKNTNYYSFEISDELYIKFINSFQHNVTDNMDLGGGKTLKGLFFKDTNGGKRKRKTRRH